ncbi:unnamed protein product [Prunus armeniaca]
MGGNGRAESIESAEMGRNCQRKLMDKLHGNGGVVSPTKEGQFLWAGGHGVDQSTSGDPPLPEHVANPRLCAREEDDDYNSKEDINKSRSLDFSSWRARRESNHKWNGLAANLVVEDEAWEPE